MKKRVFYYVDGFLTSKWVDDAEVEREHDGIDEKNDPGLKRSDPEMSDGVSNGTGNNESHKN